VSGLKTASLGRQYTGIEMALLIAQSSFQRASLFDKWSRSNSSLAVQTRINQVG